MSSVNSMRMVVKFSILGPLDNIESEVVAGKSRYFAENVSISRILKQRSNWFYRQRIPLKVRSFILLTNKQLGRRRYFFYNVKLTRL